MIKSSLIILAGGGSSRMGVDKGLMLFEGKPMIKHLLDRFEGHFDQIIISSSLNGYKRFGHMVVPDANPNNGPIGGIITSLKVSKNDFNFILSCDSPFVSFKLLEHLMTSKINYDITIGEHSGVTHPFPGLYNINVLNDLIDLFKKGERKMMNLKCYFSVGIIDCSELDRLNFKNYNSMADFKKKS